VNELRPLLRDDPTDPEERLLRSARLDKPPASGKARTLASLGAAAAMTTAASTGSATATVVGGVSVAKWLVVGALGGTVAVGAVGELAPLLRDAPRRGPVSVVLPPSAAIAPTEGKGALRALPIPRAATEVPREPPPADQPEDRDHRGEVSQTFATASAPAVSRPQQLNPSPGALVPSGPAPELPTTKPAAAGSLADEVNALEEARHAFALGDMQSALRALDDYDRRFAGQRLGLEASMLRIEALVAQKQLDRARELGQELLAKDPHGAYAQRVRSLLADPNR
jgi:hypothetical protein